MIYEFDDFRLDTANRTLFRGPSELRLLPKAFALLEVLAEAADEMISREEIMHRVWPDTHVEESSLRFCVHSLRKALGRAPDGKQYIENRPRIGYRLNAEVRRVSTEIAQRPVSADAAPAGSNRSLLRVPVAVSTLLVLLSSTIWFATRTQSSDFRPARLRVQIAPFAIIGETGDQDGLAVAPAIASELALYRNISASVIADSGTESRDPSGDVMTGSCRIEKNGVGVRASLRRGGTNEVVWSGDFLIENTDTISTADAVGVKIAYELGQRFEEIGNAAAIDRTKRSADAVESFLMARRIWRSGEFSRRSELIQLFEKVIQLEPDWADAVAGYAEALLLADGDDANWAKADELARRALAIDPESAAALGVIAEIHFRRDRLWDQAETELRRAISASPDYGPNHWRMSELLRRQRRFGEAQSSIAKAIEFDPFSPLFRASRCELLRFEYRYGAAAAECGKAMAMNPGYWRASKMLFWIYVDTNDFERLGRIILADVPESSRGTHPFTAAAAKRSLATYWEFQLDDYLERHQQSPRPLSVARTYLKLGDKQRSLDYLEQAFDDVADRDLAIINADPTFDPLRSEPRFRDLMARLGLDTKR